MVLMNPKALVAGLSQAEARQAIEQAPAFKACDPAGSSGTVNIKLKIGAAGNVTAVDAIGSGSASSFGKCVVEAARGVSFPPKGVESSLDVLITAAR